MRGASIVNGAGVVIALAVSMAMALVDPPDREATASATDQAAPDTPTSLVDATGTEVPVRAYARIVSASTVADELVLELCDARRLVAVTALSAEGPDAHRFEGRETIASIDETERIVSLEPDLVLVHNVAEPRRVARLREAGLVVFDLGALEGVRSLETDIVQVATLCGARDRGQTYRDRWRGRLARVADGRAPSERALYLTIYGDRLYGGAEGTSYHDVIEAAGLADAASGRYEGWPQYAIEQVLELDPDLIVTRPEMGRRICRGALSTLRACRDDAIIELDETLLDDPGPGILDAAEALRDAVEAR